MAMKQNAKDDNNVQPGVVVVRAGRVHRCTHGRPAICVLEITVWFSFEGGNEGVSDGRYCTARETMVVSSSDWTPVHGFLPEQVLEQ